MWLKAIARPIEFGAWAETVSRTFSSRHWFQDKNITGVAGVDQAHFYIKFALSELPEKNTSRILAARAETE